MNLMSPLFEQMWEPEIPEECCTRCGAEVELSNDEWKAAQDVYMGTIGKRTASPYALKNGALRFPSGVVLSGTGAPYCAECGPTVALCRVCGCTDEAGCADGCEWVEVDLCSSCWSALLLKAGIENMTKLYYFAFRVAGIGPQNRV